MKEFTEEFVREHGFEDLKEFFKLVSSVDLTTTPKVVAFKKWQNDDCTKEGLYTLQNSF